jgi:phosphoribosyl 1,2-cyclic phosphodiesterase
MQVRVWGCRGSYPVSGSDFIRYGGNTSCVEVRENNTLVILDAGTGMRPLGLSLSERLHRTNHVHVLISHTHWDHIIGLPFFLPLQNPRTHVTVYGLGRLKSRLKTTLLGSLDRPLFPVPVASMPAKIDFREVGAHSFLNISPDVQITTAQLNHPYRAVGYRVQSKTGCLAYITDTAPFDRVLFGDKQVSWAASRRVLDARSLRVLARIRQGVLHLANKADWVIYDTQFRAQEYAQRPHWGHSTPQHAIDIAAEAGARHLILFHHDPHRADREIDTIVANYRAGAYERGLMLSAAYEGLMLAQE